MLLVSLIGDQPIPNLLPIRHLNPDRVLLVFSIRTRAVACRLRRIISGSDDVSLDLLTDAFDFNAVYESIHERLKTETQVTFNLTGGTKMMALAAYAEAAERRAPFIYLNSEPGRSLLSRFDFDHVGPRQIGVEEIGEVITIADYLHAHLSDCEIKGPLVGKLEKMDAGHQFERALYDALKPRLSEVAARVIPTSPGIDEGHHQIEIDLVVRVGNQVGIVEAKVGGNIGKDGLDQLKMACEPTFLGTYTAQFLIAAADRLKGKNEQLARERRIKVIFTPEYTPGAPLSAVDADRVAGEIRRRLSGEDPGGL